MQPILACMKFCNKYLIMIINHTNRMTFGTQVARKSKSQLFQRFGPEDELQWAMAEDHTSSTTCEGSDWNDSAQGGQREEKNPVFHSNLQLSQIWSYSFLCWNCGIFSIFSMITFLSIESISGPNRYPAPGQHLLLSLAISRLCSISSSEPPGFLCFLFIVFWTLSSIGLLAL